MSMNELIQRIKLFFCGACGKKAQIGTIKFFDRKKRFGFIVSNKNEYFFHAAATKPSDFKWLQDGANVRFHVIAGKKGPQADRVEVIHQSGK